MSIPTTVMNLGGINHMNRLAWEIMLCAQQLHLETVLIHLLLAVALLPRAGTSTGHVNVLSASPSPHPQEISSGTIQKLLGVREDIC